MSEHGEGGGEQQKKKKWNWKGGQRSFGKFRDDPNQSSILIFQPLIIDPQLRDHQNFQAVRKNDGRFDDVTPDDVYDFRAEDGSFEEFEDSLFDEEEVEGVALKKSG